MSSSRETVRVDRFERPEDFRDFFKTYYGPKISFYTAIADDADKVAALDRELADLAQRHHHGSGSTAMDWEYLFVTAHKVA